MDLLYRPRCFIEDLALGECTMHRASGAANARWWQLWFFVRRDDTGRPEIFCVPMNPGGSFRAHGPGGKTWGLTRTGQEGAWQVSPSIDVQADGDASEGAGTGGGRALPSRWHQTPTIVNVPLDEAWACGEPA